MGDNCSGELVAADVRKGIGKGGHLPFGEYEVRVAIGRRIHFDQNVIRCRRRRQWYGAESVWLLETFEELSSHRVGEVCSHDEIVDDAIRTTDFQKDS